MGEAEFHKANKNAKNGKFQLNSVVDEYEGKPSTVVYSCMRHQGPFHSTRATKK